MNSQLPQSTNSSDNQMEYPLPTATIHRPWTLVRKIKITERHPAPTQDAHQAPPSAPSALQETVEDSSDFYISATDVDAMIDTMVTRMQQHLLFKRLRLLNRPLLSEDEAAQLRDLDQCDYSASIYQQHRSQCKHPNKSCVWKQGSYLMAEFSHHLVDLNLRDHPVARISYIKEKAPPQ